MLKLISGALSKQLYPSCHDSLMLGKVVEAGELLCTLELPVKRGWHMIECQTKKACALSFLCDEPSGDSNNVFELPIHKPGLTKRIIFLQDNIAAMQVTLKGLTNLSDLRSLRFVPLRRSFAIKRMLKRLRADEAYMQQQALRSKRSFDVFLSGAYNNIFSSDSDARYQYWVLQAEPELLGRYVDNFASEPEPDDSEFVVVCAPGYQWIPEAKRLMEFCLQRHPQAKLVYADEDVIDHAGQRSQPYFKPDWNPDLFMAHDYISSCYMCRRSWYESNQSAFGKYGDYLALTHLLPTMQAGEVRHIPLVLAHTEKQHQPMPDTLPSAQRARILSEVLPSGVSVEPGLIEGACRVRYALPDSPPLVSLLIPTRDGLSILKPCVESILRETTYPNFEILILDNQSQCPDTLDWLDDIQKDSRIKVLPYNHPFNYSAINNFGASHAQGDVIGLVNNDVEVISPGWLSEMIGHALRPEIGCVGAKLYYSNGQIQHGGVVLGLGDVAGHAHRFLQGDDDGYHGRLKLVQNYSAVTAACLVVKRAIFDKVGGLEEEHLTVAYNDVDFCLRVQEAGYRNLWTPYAELYHHESISRGEDNTPEKQLRYEKEVGYMKSVWGEKLKSDPCYNPNLSLRREDFSLSEFVVKGDLL